MLAFLVDPLQKHACPLFQQALEKNHSMRGLWDKIRVFFLGFLMEDWTTFFHALPVPKAHLCLLLHGDRRPTSNPTIFRRAGIADYLDIFME